MALSRETGVDLMADLADIETSMVGLITGALYPGGATSPSKAGADCRIYRGWPTPAGLDADLKSGTLNVTVFPDGTPGQTLNRYLSEWHGTRIAPTLSAAATGSNVTFDGSADVGQIAGIRFANRTFVYRTVAGDTPESVAANLASTIRERQLVQLSGRTLTIPGVANIIARIVADGPVLREVRRQTQDFRISFWCPTPVLRDDATAIVDMALASLSFIDFPDTSVGRVIYKNTAVFDQSQSAILYRRDLIYSVEYPTVVSAMLPAMLFGELALGATTVSV
jgi:hypothetical protein